MPAPLVAVDTWHVASVRSHATGIVELIPLCVETQQQRGGWGPARLDNSLHGQLPGGGWRVAVSTAPRRARQGLGLTHSLLSRLAVACRCAAPARATRACAPSLPLPRDLTLLPRVPLVSFVIVDSLLFSSPPLASPICSSHLAQLGVVIVVVGVADVVVVIFVVAVVVVVAAAAVVVVAVAAAAAETINQG